jgi:hypothetical protein
VTALFPLGCYFNLTTIAIFLGHGDTWNYWASWLAIIVEWMVGTYMFGREGLWPVTSLLMACLGDSWDSVVSCSS